MLRKIILENYMAHVKTVIEPVAGLTVLIGPNNCGKSAIIHALEMICYNSDAADFAIRHGTKKATVTLETQDEDGTIHTLIWWRKKGTAGYSIDGREISGLGRGIPDDLHQYLKMPEIPAATGKPFRIHFGLQKSPIFLLDDTQSRAAQFFASSSDADRLMEMQRRHTQKVGNARRDKDRLDKEVLELDRQLEIFAPLPELSKQVALLEREHAEIAESQTQVKGMQQCIELLEQATRSNEICQQRAAALTPLELPPVLPSVLPLMHAIASISDGELQVEINFARRDRLAELKALPALSETAPLTQLIVGLETATRRFEHDQQRSLSLESLQIVPDLGDAASLSQTIEKSAQLTEQLQQHVARSTVLGALMDEPVMMDAARLKWQIQQMEVATENVNRLQLRHTLLHVLPTPCEATDIKPLSVQIEKLGHAASDVEREEKSLRSAEKKLKQLAEQITQWVKLNPRCDTCGQRISADLILAGDHGQGAHHE